MTSTVTAGAPAVEMAVAGALRFFRGLQLAGGWRLSAGGCCRQLRRVDMVLPSDTTSVNSE